MKFCISSRQKKEYLQKADEIKVQYRDRNSIFDLIENYPAKTIILDCLNADIDWKEIEKYKVLTKNNFIICVNNINELRQAHTCGIRCYFGYPVSSFWELNSLLDFDVEYVKLDMELFFQMPKVKKMGGKIRVTPNVAYNDGLPHKNGVCGQWIRPEDLDIVYGDYIDAVEFEDCDLEKEQALFRIYAENHEWRQDLQLIITNLDYPAVNRMISSDLSRSRLNCAHKCQKGGICRLCEHELFLANPDFFKDYVDKEKKL